MEGQSYLVGCMEMIMKKQLVGIKFLEYNIVDKTLWGEPLEEDIEEQLGEPEMTEVEPKTNTEEKSGFASVISGMETPDIELQKKPTNASHSVQNINYNSKDSVPKPLYQVLEPVQVRRRHESF